jgi:low temperature requirement protein LtrA
MTASVPNRAHRLRLMSGRDPHEQHRTVTPLELLYDLTFVVAFG